MIKLSDQERDVLLGIGMMGHVNEEDIHDMEASSMEYQDAREHLEHNLKLIELLNNKGNIEYILTSKGKKLYDKILAVNTGNYDPATGEDDLSRSIKRQR